MVVVVSENVKVHPDADASCRHPKRILMASGGWTEISTIGAPILCRGIIRYSNIFAVRRPNMVILPSSGCNLDQFFILAMP